MSLSYLPPPSRGKSYYFPFLQLTPLSTMRRPRPTPLDLLFGASVFFVFTVIALHNADLSVRALPVQRSQPTQPSQPPSSSDEDTCMKLIRDSAHPTSPRAKISSSLGNLVGSGWDDLTSEPTAPVFAQHYKQCSVSPDGHYLVPDGISAQPVLASQFDSFARCYSSYEDYYKATATEMGAGGGASYGGFGLSGSFATANQEVGYSDRL